MSPCRRGTVAPDTPLDQVPGQRLRALLPARAALQRNASVPDLAAAVPALHVQGLEVEVRLLPGQLSLVHCRRVAVHIMPHPAFRLRTSWFVCVACGIDTSTTADGKCHCWGY